MNQKRWAGVVAVMVIACSPAVVADVTESRTIRQSFDLAPSGKVAVDTLYGSIEVIGTTGNRVEMVVTETIEAKDREALERARAEVELLVESTDALLTSATGQPLSTASGRERSPRVVATPVAPAVRGALRLRAARTGRRDGRPENGDRG